MYCNIPMYLTYKKSMVMLVVTEIEYNPEQRGTKHCEPLTESVGIKAGYVISEDFDCSFDEVLEANTAEVVKTCLKWYKEI